MIELQPGDSRSSNSGRRRVVTAVASMAICLGLAPTASLQEAVAAPAPPSANFLVPAYFYPDGSNWQHVCGQLGPAGANRAGVMIMNPDNGVGMRPTGSATTNPYLKAIGDCHRQGQRVIGYVSTDYARRSRTEVTEEISRYYSWYGVDGVFLDEMSNDATTEAYYAAIYAHTRRRSSSGRLVVGNPGVTASTSWQVDGTPVADVIVNFEGTAATYEHWRAPDWVNTSSVSRDRFAHLVYKAVRPPVVQGVLQTPPGPIYPQSARGICEISRDRKHGWIDVTYDDLPNPWNDEPALTSMINYC